MSKKVVLAGACRTAIGKMGGALSTTPAPKLGSIVIEEALKRAGVPKDAVDHVYMGCVIQAGLGQNVPSMPAFCRFLLKPKSHSVQRCNRAACIGTVQFKGLGVPNKYFAKQNKQMYIRLHCLQQL